MPQNLYFTPRNDIMIRVDFFNELFFFLRIEVISTIRYASHYILIYSPDIVFVFNNNITTRGVTVIFLVYPRQARKVTHIYRRYCG